MPMFHVKQLLLFSLLFFVTINVKCQGTLTLQDKPFVFDRSIDSALWKELQKDNNFRLLQENEQLMFYWTNKFRKEPRRFFQEVIREFIKQFPEANTAEIRSLEKDISNVKVVLPVLLPDKGLFDMARLQSSDLIKRGSIISHKSFTGKDFVQRVKDAGFYRCAAENIYVGAFDPLEALIALLVDYGVPDKGHRMNILDSRFGRMGLSFPLVSSNRGLLVQDFACP